MPTLAKEPAIASYAARETKENLQLSLLVAIFAIEQIQESVMQFEYTSPQTDLEELLGGNHCINAFGSITVGDDERFIEFLERLDVPPRTPVYIDSTGGDVDAAINIGRIIRDHWFSTHVGRNVLDGEYEGGFLKKRRLIGGRCMSAATLVFLGGRLRYLNEDAKFGVHQFSFQDPSPNHIPRSQILSAKIARFVSDMGIHPEFLELSSGTPNTEIRALSIEQLELLGVVTGGETPVKWSIEAVDGVLYVRGERDSIYGHHKMLLGFAKPDGFFVYAVIESQGREDELTTFPLVELVVSNPTETSIDISERCNRFVQGIYTNISLRITAEEAALIASSTGFGIRVRGGPDAGVFLGISPMSTAGASHLFQSFVGNLSR